MWVVMRETEGKKEREKERMGLIPLLYSERETKTFLHQTASYQESLKLPKLLPLSGYPKRQPTSGATKEPGGLPWWRSG